jgi:hypothetical protein
LPPYRTNSPSASGVMNDIRFLETVREQINVPF